MRWKCAICGTKFMLSCSQQQKHKYAGRRKFVCSLPCRGQLVAVIRRVTLGQQPISADIMARKKVLQAIQNGDLARPNKCENCGDIPGLNSLGRASLHAHHHLGPSKPLAVRWLCPPCHSKVDAGRQKRGEHHANAKLTTKDVRRIRRGGSTTAFMRELGVSKATILRVKKRSTWMHVP